MKNSQTMKRIIILLLVVIVIITTTTTFSTAAELDPPPSSNTYIDEELFQSTIRRQSPSKFPAHFTTTTRRGGQKQSENNNRANFEDSITRTSGSNCVQQSGSTISCDMCCNGQCCENPGTWTPKSESMSNAQSWIPVRFAFVVPNSYSLSSLPTQTAQAQLLGKVNQAFEYVPFRFLYSNQTIIQNDTVWGHCATDPCFTSSTCGFIDTLLPAVNADVHNEIVVIMCHGISYLGEAQFPWAAPSVQYLQLQLARGMTTPTIVHELGHYLGLFHTFEGGCTSTDQGDWVSDTNQASSANGNCNVVKDSCTGIAGVDDSYNYMNYGLEWTCGLSFTNGQISRAVAAMEYYRPTLIKNTKVSLTTSNSQVDLTGFQRTPACTTLAESFTDCWCENEFLNPATWCKTAAPLGTTFTAGETPAPRASAETMFCCNIMVLTLLFVMLLAML